MPRTVYIYILFGGGGGGGGGGWSVWETSTCPCTSLFSAVPSLVTTVFTYTMVTSPSNNTVMSNMWG